MPNTARIVGQSVHELVLTNALGRFSKQLLPPGVGRSVITIPEVPIGRGRPDILMVVLAKASLNSYIKSGLQVETLNHAYRISADTEHGDARKSLNRTSDWTPQNFRMYAKAVADSLAVEAKIKDWKQAIRQASRFRHLSHRAAIMLPTSRSSKKIDPYLGTYGLGLITLEEGKPTWDIQAQKTELSPAKRLWLLELAAREVRTKSPLHP